MRRFPTAPAPHVPARRSVRGLMRHVLVALLPGTAMQAYWFGPGVLLQLLLAVTFALLLEAAMLRLRGVALQPAIGDLSAPLTAVLFALCVPPGAPWWVAAVGMLVAIVFAKQLYGGIGRNLFNPAMAGYAAALLAFPLPLSQWPAPGDAWSAALALLPGAAGGLDAVVQATPLSLLREAEGSGRTLPELAADPRLAEGRSAWAWIALAHAAGGAWLLLKRDIGWRVPTAVLVTAAMASLPAWLADSAIHPSPLEHLAMGGLVMAAFFVATDPVTGCTTPRGQLLFGAGVALLALAIRAFGAYPDGIAFAVLLMNAAAPFIDLHTRPRIFGEPPRSVPPA